MTNHIAKQVGIIAHSLGKIKVHKDRTDTMGQLFWMEDSPLVAAFKMTRIDNYVNAVRSALRRNNK